ncbi:MAG: hypothetical protein ACRBFS_10365 [Aureispira sp.]
MPKAKYFLDALEAATSKNDPNLPKNKEKVAADKKEELKQWKAKYKNLNNVYGIKEGKVMNKIYVG